MTTLLAFTVVGIVTGAIYAVAASGLVVTYTTSGIFNFAHGAIGMFMAFLYWELRVHNHWPAPIALFVVVLVVSPLAGAVIERMLMRKLSGAPLRLTIVVTLALLVALLGLAQSIWSPTEGRRLPAFFAGSQIKLFSVRVSYHDIIVLAVAAAIAIFLRLLLFHTRTGVTMRAVVDNRDLSGLNGVYPERVAQLSWALGATLAALAGILIAPTITLNHNVLTLLVVNGYAAAMLGRLTSLPYTFMGALILGLAQSYLIGYGSSVEFGSFRLIDAGQVVPTIFLFLIVVFLPRTTLRAGRIVGARAPSVPGLRQSLVASAVFIVLMGLLSTQLSEFWLFNVSSALVVGMVLLSLVVLTGFAGQISLMQMTFVGVGCATFGRMFSGGGLEGVIAAGVVAGVMGAIVALPVLKLQELYLALVTLAFALFGDWAFIQSWGFGGGGGILTLRRLRIFGIHFESEKSQLVLLAIAFSLFAIGVLVIRRSPYGRRLAALRDSPVAAATVGMNLVATKTTVFALSAAMAGVAGALFGGLRVTASANDFAFFQSLAFFLVAVFGGITTVAGALFGGIFLAILPELQKHVNIENLQAYLIALGAISLADRPHGVGADISLAGEQIRAALRARRAGPPSAGATDPSVATSAPTDGDGVGVRERAGVG